MSLFSDFASSELIKNPKDSWSYRRILEERNNTEVVKTEKEIRKEMREKLSKEEYEKRWHQQNYQKRKEQLAEKYQKDKEEKEAMIEEIYRDVYDPIPIPLTQDEEYLLKYMDDNVDWEWRYRYSWRASHLQKLYRFKCDTINYPIRIMNNYNMNSLWMQQLNMQDKVYNYLLPILDELKIDDCRMSDNQKVTARPLRMSRWRMLEIIDNTSLPAHQLCELMQAMKKWIYIMSEVFLWHISFLCGDMICTSMWQMFFPSLVNNLPWLTPDTVDNEHKERMAFHKYEMWASPTIAVLYDAHLIRVPSIKIQDEKWNWTNYKKFDYYVVPQWWRCTLPKFIS